jgi:hypothetical protein
MPPDGGRARMSHEATRLAWLTKEPHHGARLVLLALADHHNATTNECYPSVARLAETTLLERKAVIRGLAELERLGVIGTERKNGCGSRYKLHFLDQSQNGTGDKMGPVPKRDGTGDKMGRDRSQNGTRNRERTGKEPGNRLVDQPAECQPNTPTAGSQDEPASTEPKPDKPSPSPECPPDAPEPTSAVMTPSEKKNPATVARTLRPRPDKVTIQDRARWNEELRFIESLIASIKRTPFYKRKKREKELAELEHRKAELKAWLDGKEAA